MIKNPRRPGFCSWLHQNQKYLAKDEISTLANRWTRSEIEIPKVFPHIREGESNILTNVVTSCGPIEA